MNRNEEKRAGGKRGGIRLNQLNILLICLGLAISALLVVSMYQTSNSVREIAAVTDNYLNNQQAGGMMRDVSGRMAGLGRLPGRPEGQVRLPGGTLGGRTVSRGLPRRPAPEQICAIHFCAGKGT